MRPLHEVLEIAETLRQPLELSFLELAIGVRCHVNDEYGQWPLALHDSCLSGGSLHRPARFRFDLLEPGSWKPYKRFIEAHDVVAMSAHAPLRSRVDARSLEQMVRRCSDELGVLVMVEVMPESQRWCSSLDSLIGVPLLVDVSHVHIWSNGLRNDTSRLTRQILENHDVRGLHLSHNDGHRDSHDLIPEDVWFADYIDEWLPGRLTTFESLPEVFHAHARLDITPNRWRR
jgi:hypothetical protein